MEMLSQEVWDPSLFLLISSGMVWRQSPPQPPAAFFFFVRLFPSFLHAIFWVKLKENEGKR